MLYLPPQDQIIQYMQPKLFKSNIHIIEKCSIPTINRTNNHEVM